MRTVILGFNTAVAQSWTADRDCVLVGSQSSLTGVLSSDPALTWATFSAGSYPSFADTVEEGLFFPVGAGWMSGMKIPFSAGQKIFISVGSSGGYVLLFLAEPDEFQLSFP